MLLKATSDIKNYFTVTAGFEFSDLLPHLNSSLDKYIYPFVSKTQYADLDSAYSVATPSLSPAQTELLPYIQRMLVNIGMYKYSFLGDKSIARNGIMVNEADTQKMANQWRVEDLREFALTEYDSATESTLEFLETNKGTYTLWAVSTAYTITKECFINSASEFSELYMLKNKRRSYLALKGIMKQVEVDSIMSITGENLYNQLKSQISSGSVTADNEKLLKLIKPSVASLTGARAIRDLAFDVDEGGLTVLSSSSSLTQKVKTNASADLLSFRMKSAFDYGESKREQLRKFLYDNHATYPLFEADTTVYVSSPTTDINTEGNGIIGLM